MHLNEKLIALRKRNGWTQEELAYQLDVSYQAISKWENGLAQPSLENLIKIAEIFEVSTDYLLKDELTEISPIQTNTSAPTPKHIQFIRKRSWQLSALLTVLLLVTACVLDLLVEKKTFWHHWLDWFMTVTVQMLLLKFLIILVASKCDKESLLGEIKGLLFSLIFFIPSYYMRSLFAGGASLSATYLIYFQPVLAGLAVIVAIWKKNPLFLLITVGSIPTYLAGIYFNRRIAALQYFPTIILLLSSVALLCINARKKKFNTQTLLLLLLMGVISSAFYFFRIRIEIGSFIKHYDVMDYHNAYQFLIIIGFLLQPIAHYLPVKTKSTNDALSCAPLIIVIQASALQLFEALTSWNVAEYYDCSRCTTMAICCIILFLSLAFSQILNSKEKKYEKNK